MRIWVVAFVGGCVVSVGDDKGKGDGSLSDCVGNYTGSYDGADSGVAAAVLEDDGTLSVVFTSDAGATDSEGFVTDDGEVSGVEGIISITGEWNFDECSGSGTWFSSDVPSGSWVLALE